MYFFLVKIFVFFIRFFYTKRSLPKSILCTEFIIGKKIELISNLYLIFAYSGSQ